MVRRSHTVSSMGLVLSSTTGGLVTALALLMTGQALPSDSVEPDTEVLEPLWRQLVSNVTSRSKPP